MEMRTEGTKKEKRGGETFLFFIFFIY
jgi:hypothetical protein